MISKQGKKLRKELYMSAVKKPPSPNPYRHDESRWILNFFGHDPPVESMNARP